MEGTYNDHLVQLPDHIRADQVKTCYYGHCPNASWDMDRLFREPVPVFEHPLGKEMLLHVRLKPPLVQL